jgi:hypothetical protein
MIRDVWHRLGLEDVWRDASVAIRMLRRAPLFAATVVVTVGLGVGVNTLVFSVVEGLVLRPLPIEQVAPRMHRTLRRLDVHHRDAIARQAGERPVSIAKLSI